MPKRQRDLRTKGAISFLIVAIVALQVYTSFRMCTRIPLALSFIESNTLKPSCSPSLWPFLTYPMYQHARYEGDQSIDYRIYAVFEDSVQVRVSPDDLKIGFWKYRSDLVPAIRDQLDDEIAEYANRIAELHGKVPVRLQLRAKPWTLRHDGFEEGAEITLNEVEAR